MGDQSAPAFDLVEPRAVSGREVQVKSWSPCQPGAHARMLVGGVVVANEVHLELGGDAGLDMPQKRRRLLTPMPPLTLGKHAAVGDIEPQTRWWSHVAHSRE